VYDEQEEIVIWLPASGVIEYHVVGPLRFGLQLLELVVAPLVVPNNEIGSVKGPGTATAEHGP
jgi:hypothetical protein